MGASANNLLMVTVSLDVGRNDNHTDCIEVVVAVEERHRCDRADTLADNVLAYKVACSDRALVDKYMVPVIYFRNRNFYVFVYTL